MKLTDYLKDKGHGALGRLARASQVHAPDMSRWASGRRPVPLERCLAIERATSGAVCRWDLRPADWWLIWPELIGQDGAPLLPDTAAAEREEGCA
jgi:DNA-binding transcriptional regulator YdaS (Cro superfamily)